MVVVLCAGIYKADMVVCLYITEVCQHSLTMLVVSLIAGNAFSALPYSFEQFPRTADGIRIGVVWIHTWLA